ncbi:MAG TPA: rRNA maturation RNase YbeY [Bacteroidota bacterium]|nr:rRNA maturation RNase YbeY [Bacteroidota bacterium]
MNVVRVINANPRHRRRHAETVRLVRSVLLAERKKHAEIGVVFVDDKKMLGLNSAFLRHRYPTDVLSFPLSSKRDVPLEGEVYVNLDQAKRQARDYSVEFSEETHRLVIHGVLHLLGYDDATRSQQQQMRQLEDRYLQSV